MPCGFLEILGVGRPSHPFNANEEVVATKSKAAKKRALIDSYNNRSSRCPKSLI
jgi:hypothetical protein